MRKPVIWADSRVFNDKSGFSKKKLCAGLTFTAGTACALSCVYCYVEAMVGRRAYVRAALAGTSLGLRDVVIRRRDPVTKLKMALGSRYQGAKWRGKVIYASPLVDVAATAELARETVALCKLVLDQTDLDIRLLSKSPLLKSHVADRLDADREYRSRARERMIFGLSTGTLDDDVARAIEPDSPAVSRRLEALAQLQDDHWRTYGMLCPILPQDPTQYVAKLRERIQLDRCEHVFAEPLNVRRDSVRRAIDALRAAGFSDWAASLGAVSGRGGKAAWERYAREFFTVLEAAVPSRSGRTVPRLRFLQYTTQSSERWWRRRTVLGAVPL